MTEQFLNNIENNLTKSDFASYLGSLKKSRQNPYGFRALEEKEIQGLVKNGNRCSDWTLIHVRSGFLPDTVHNCEFSGNCFLGLFNASIDTGLLKGLKRGLYNSRFHDCFIENDALVQSCALVTRQHINAKAVLFNCGLVGSDESHYFGQNIILTVGSEVKGRKIPMLCEMDLETASEFSGINPPLQQEVLKKATSSYLKNIHSGWGYIGAGAQILHTGKIHNSFIGDYAFIEQSIEISNSVLLSSLEEPVSVSAGTIIKNSSLQWGSILHSSALCDSSLLLEHSGAERHAKVIESVIGPNTTAGAGETTHCLIGPFVGVHHQSLLISVLWPEGKGNIGYGANVGSNHTGRLPDQEARPGEGFFAGLGTSLKFPFDFTDAPYSIVSSGLTTLPQRVALPFSLINTPSLNQESVSPAYNEIFPGWMISDSCYSLFRYEIKFSTRNKAAKHVFEGGIFRKDLADKVYTALCSLVQLTGKEIYTPEDIGLAGKNYLTEQSRKKGIAAYRNYLELWGNEFSGTGKLSTDDREKLENAGIFISINQPENRAKTAELLSEWRKQAVLCREKDFKREENIFAGQNLHRTLDHDEVLMYLDKKITELGSF